MVLKGIYRDILVYTATTVLALVVLILLGEERPDVYMLVTILVYFTATGLLPSARREARLWVADIVLLLVFTATVAYRVATAIGLHG